MQKKRLQSKTVWNKNDAMPLCRFHAKFSVARWTHVQYYQLVARACADNIPFAIRIRWLIPLIILFAEQLNWFWVCRLMAYSIISTRRIYPFIETRITKHAISNIIRPIRLLCLNADALWYVSKPIISRCNYPKNSRISLVLL